MVQSRQSTQGQIKAPFSSGMGEGLIRSASGKGYSANFAQTAFYEDLGSTYSPSFPSKSRKSLEIIARNAYRNVQ